MRADRGAGSFEFGHGRGHVRGPDAVTAGGGRETEVVARVVGDEIAIARELQAGALARRRRAEAAESIVRPGQIVGANRKCESTEGHRRHSLVADQHRVGHAIVRPGTERHASVHAAVVVGTTCRLRQGHAGRWVRRVCQRFRESRNLVGQQSIELAVLDGCGDVATIAREVDAADESHAVVRHAAVFELTELPEGLKAFEVGLQLHVDHAGNGVGAVYGRASHREIVDAVDQDRGNEIEIDLRAGGRGSEDVGGVRIDHATSVHQRQRAIAAEPEAVHEADARSVVGLVSFRRHTRPEAGRFVERIGDVGEAARGDVFTTDRHVGFQRVPR